MKMINIFNPENHNWTFEDGKYGFHWFDGDQLPGFISKSLEEQSAYSHPDIKCLIENNNTSIIRNVNDLLGVMITLDVVWTTLGKEKDLKNKEDSPNEYRE